MKSRFIGVATLIFFNLCAVKSFAQVPATPNTIAASAISQTDFTANWDIVPDANNYFIDVATDPNFMSLVSGYVDLSVASNSVLVTGLSAGTTYYYQVRAGNVNGVSGNSAPISVLTISETPVVMSATFLSQTGFTSNWYSANGASGYFIDVATDAGFTSFVPGFNNLAVFSTSVAITGLSPSTTYYYQVRSTNASGDSPSSNVVSQQTISANPTATAAGSITQNSFIANWNALAGVDGYYVDVATDPGFTTLASGYSNLDVTTNSLLVSGLSPATTYYYQVRSHNAAGVSGNSSAIAVLTIPLTPTTTGATAVTQSGFTANWNTVAGADNYFIDVATDASFNTLISGYSNLLSSSTSLSVTGLSAGVVYYYRVRSSNSTGDSPSSNAISQITIPSAPAASAATSISQTGFTANWNAVTGASNYFLDVATDAGFSNFVSGYSNTIVATTSSSITGLSPGTTYYYQVRSSNAGGTSSSSNAISQITTPDTPTAALATSISQTGFTANWNVVTGASNYFLDVATDAGFSNFVLGYSNAIVAATSASITGLSPGTTYYYQVRSSNAGGVSPSSNIISQITIPGNPTALEETVTTQSSFTANWSPVTGASGYYLDVASDAAFTSLLASYNGLAVTSNSSVVSGLSSGTIYYYRIRAANSTGTSGNSLTITAQTLPTDPVASAASSVTSTSFVANWAAVNGATSYRIDVAIDNTFTTKVHNDIDVGMLTSYTATSLSSGVVYYYRVRAINNAGSSTYSNVISQITIPAAPIASAATSITQTNFTANWNASIGASGYFIDVATDAAFTSFVSGYNNKSVGSNSVLISGLSAGVTYYYKVRAANVAGTSASFSMISQITAAATPVATAATSIGQNGFTANWNAVTGASTYFIDVATDAAFTSLVTGFNNKSVTSNSVSVIGLTAGVTYYYQVRSFNAAGTSSSSNMISQLTISSTPTALAASVITQTSFTANWSSVSGASGYFIDVATDAAFTSILSSYNSLSVVSTSTVVAGVSSGVAYYYRVRATNSAGTSGSSSTITVRVLPADPIATAASSITSGSFTANWGSVVGASSYRVDVATDNAFTNKIYNDTDAGNSTSYAVNSLNSGSTYYYRVRALNTTGSSSYSNIISLATPFVAPAIQASNISFSALNTTSLTVSFTTGSGTARLVSVNAGSPLLTNPVNGQTYIGNAAFGNGSTLGTGFVVMNGTANSVTVTNLSPGTIYYVQVYEYTGTPGAEAYATSTSTNNPNHQATLATQPSVQASSLSFSSVSSSSLTLNFSNGNGASRLILARAGSQVNSVPVDGVSYTVSNFFGAGSQVGSGNYVVGTGNGPVVITGLSPATVYYFEVFEFNGSGGTEHYNVSVTGNQGSHTTLTTSPNVQSGNISFSNVTSNSVSVNFTPGDGTAHLIVVTSNGPLSTLPVNGTGYNSNTQYGIGDVLGTGYIVGNGVGPIAIQGLSPSTAYYFRVFDFNGSSGSESYLTTSSANNPLSVTTLAPQPLGQPGALSFSQNTGTSINVSFQPAPSPVDGYLVIRSSNGAVNSTPVSGNVYSKGASIGNSEVAYIGSSNSFVDGNLPTNTQYFYAVFSYNGSGLSTNYLATSPAIGNVILDTAPPVISFASPNPTTVLQGSSQTLSVMATDNFGVSKVEILHRRISDDLFIADLLSLNSGGYVIQTNASWYDSLGIEYYLIATDQNGNVSPKPPSNFFIRSIQPSITYQVPYNKGNGSVDYRIFSFPYNLSPSNSVATVFPNVESRDVSKFRMLRYNPAKSATDEYAKNEITALDVGAGYWILASSPLSATVSNAFAPSFSRDKLDSIQLLPGWNQIGNPYPVSITWSDVQHFVGQHAGVDTLSFYTFQNGWVKLKTNEKIPAFTGGFVKNPTTSSFYVTIPFQGQTVKGGRTTMPEPNSDISKEYWEIDLNVFQGEAQNRIGGVGMAPNAFYGVDRYDDSNPPGFAGMPELLFNQKEVNVKDLARSVVPTQREYAWSFNVNGTIGSATDLVWNNDLGQGSERLLLLDETTMQMIDMRSVQKHSFVLAANHSFKIFFGDMVNVSTDNIQLTAPFPNPAVERKTNFMLGLPESGSMYEVGLQVFNLSGESVYTSSVSLAGGIHQLQWQVGASDPSGLYLYRFVVRDGKENFVSTGKIAVP